MLRDINASGRARRMQATIARRAHTLVYSLDSPPVKDDAVSMLVDGLLYALRAADSSDDNGPGALRICRRVLPEWRCSPEQRRRSG